MWYLVFLFHKKHSDGIIVIVKNVANTSKKVHIK